MPPEPSQTIGRQSLHLPVQLRQSSQKPAVPILPGPLAAIGSAHVRHTAAVAACASSARALCASNPSTSSSSLAASNDPSSYSSRSARGCEAEAAAVAMHNMVRKQRPAHLQHLRPRPARCVHLGRPSPCVEQRTRHAHDLALHLSLIDRCRCSNKWCSSYCKRSHPGRSKRLPAHVSRCSANESC
jgi:hypothetical protein